MKSILSYLNKPNNNCITCPSGNCLNMPEIYYSNTIIKSEIQFKCICQNNTNKSIDLKEFLKKSNFICRKCGKNISKNVIYCKDCNIIICENCMKLWHNNHSNYDIYNSCPEHKLNYMVRCINCNKSLCNSCKIDSHDSYGHDVRFLSQISVSKNDYEGINSPFEKQKQYLEKIKDIYNNYIKSLENDIQIKERIINTYQ